MAFLLLFLDNKLELQRKNEVLMLSSLVVEVLKEYLYVSTLSPLRLRLGCTWQPQLLVSQVAAFNQDRDLQRSLAVSLPTNRHKGTSGLISKDDFL